MIKCHLVVLPKMLKGRKIHIPKQVLKGELQSSGIPDRTIRGA